jgi:hypothetical protein
MTFRQMILNRVAWRLLLLASRLLFKSDASLPNPLNLEFRTGDRPVTPHRSDASIHKYYADRGLITPAEVIDELQRLNGHGPH